MTSQKLKVESLKPDQHEVGGGGLDPVLGDPRIAPGSGVVEPPADDLGERDLSTNKVGDPIYELPPEAGRDTWGWENSPVINMSVAAYLVNNGAVMPAELHALLVEFTKREAQALSKDELERMMQAIEKVKSLPTEDP